VDGEALEALELPAILERLALHDRVVIRRRLEGAGALGAELSRRRDCEPRRDRRQLQRLEGGGIHAASVRG